MLWLWPGALPCKACCKGKGSAGVREKCKVQQEGSLRAKPVPLAPKYTVQVLSIPSPFPSQFLMSITTKDLKEHAFTSNLLEVEDLALTNSGRVDLGAIR